MGIIIQILITMAFSAFFSGMEIAFVSSNKLRFEMDRNNQSINSRILSIFFHNPNNFISTMLVGNNIALVIYGILMAQVIEQNLLAGLIDNHFLLVLIQTIISTLIILVTGEFLPKTLFKINPNFTLNIFAVPTYICYVLLYPISKFASGISNILLYIIGIKTNKEANIRIRDCMVPRTEIVAIEYGTPIEELKARFIESGISKIIVYKENIDNIIGYIHSSEMFREQTDWTKSVRQLPIAPETMGAHKLMKLFMQQKKSLAVVVDEFGGTSGIVALEDLVEEIFGEIEDEHDTTSYIAKSVGDNEYILSGRLEIEKVNELFSLDLPENDDYQTIGGLILHQYQSFPKIHEEITFDKFHFKIIKVTATKIELVKLKVTE